MIEEAQYVRLTVTGETAKADLEAGRAEAIGVLQANGLKRLLVDARQVQKNASQIDDYEFVRQHRDTPLQSAKLAVLYRVEETERFSFIEDVAINRSANLKIFTDPDQALEWLLGS